MVKKVLYLGCNGSTNVGDDLLFDIFKQLLYKECIQHGLFVNVDNLKYDSYIISKDFVVDLTQYNLIILGGGSIFAWEQFESICLKAYGCRIPYVIWGTGFDNRNKSLTEQIINSYVQHKPFLSAGRTKEIVKKSKLAGVRGNVDKFLIHSEKVHVIGDPGIIFDTLGNIYPIIHEAESFVEDDKDIVLINWGTSYNNIIGNNEHEVQNHLESAAEELTGKGYKIIVCPVWNPDIEKCRAFAQNIDNHSILRIDKVYDVYGLASIIQKCKFSINLKLHANIISMALRKPFISLAYGLKCYDFAESVNSEDLIIYTDQVNTQRLMDKADYVEKNYYSIQERFNQYISFYNKKQNLYMSKIVKILISPEAGSQYIKESKL